MVLFFEFFGVVVFVEWCVLVGVLVFCFDVVGSVVDCVVEVWVCDWDVVVFEVVVDVDFLVCFYFVVVLFDEFYLVDGEVGFGDFIWYFFEYVVEVWCFGIEVGEY